MSVVLLVPLAFLLIGALVYGFAGNAKAAELGRLLFFVGAFWLVAVFAHSQLHLP